MLARIKAHSYKWGALNHMGVFTKNHFVDERYSDNMKQLIRNKQITKVREGTRICTQFKLQSTFNCNVYHH